MGTLIETFDKVFEGSAVSARGPKTEMVASEPVVGQRRDVTVGAKVRSIDEDARTIDFVASTENPDRYGDVIRVAGWRLDNYRKNPVFLAFHQSRDFPLGRTVRIWTESDPPALVHRVEFADEKANPKAEQAFRLYKGGFMNGVSVGFMPLKRPKSIVDEEGVHTGWEFTDQELLELSAVSVPANAEALVRAVEQGVISKEFAEEVQKDWSVTSDAAANSPEQLRDQLVAQYGDLEWLKLRMSMEQLKLSLAKLRVALALRALDGNIAVPGESRIDTVEQFFDKAGLG